MKTLLCLLACASLSGILSRDSRMKLICHQWKKVGIKSFGKKYQAINAATEILTLNADGTYDQLLYGQMKVKGKWKFNRDSTRLAFEVVEYNGTKIPNSLPLDGVLPTDSIMKLSNDTLIYASLAYYGPKKVYGHDDWYLVRVK